MFLESMMGSSSPAGEYDYWREIPCFFFWTHIDLNTGQTFSLDGIELLFLDYGCGGYTMAYIPSERYDTLCEFMNRGLWTWVAVSLMCLMARDSDLTSVEIGMYRL